MGGSDEFLVVGSGRPGGHMHEVGYLGLESAQQRVSKEISLQLIFLMCKMEELYCVIPKAPDSSELCMYKLLSEGVLLLSVLASSLASASMWLGPHLMVP